MERFPRQTKVDVSRPVPTRAGATLFELPFDNRQRLACLFQDIRDVEIEITRDGIRRLGEALAWLHTSIPATVDGPVRTIDPVMIGEDTLQAIKLIAGSASVCRAIEQQYLPAVEASLYGALPQGLCHGDAWTGNARIFEGKIGFFDFDDFGQGAFMLDVGTADWHLRTRGAQSHLLTDALISSYEAVRRCPRRSERRSRCSCNWQNFAL